MNLMETGEGPATTQVAQYQQLPLFNSGPCVSMLPHPNAQTLNLVGKRPCRICNSNR